jgi:5-formyltetrahydrofolate cyclo-ligase
MTKEELRNIYRQKRLSIHPKEKTKLDDLMLIQFQKAFFRQYSTSAQLLAAVKIR